MASPAAKPGATLEESIYLTRLGLLLMTLGTTIFSAVHISLSAITRSQSLPSSSTIPQPQTSLSEDVIRRLEIQIQTLADTVARLQQQQTIVHAGKAAQLSDEESVLLQLALAGGLSLIFWIVGVVMLSEGLTKIAMVRWLRTAQLGLVGANVGVLYALWRLGGAGWSKPVLYGFVGVDVGMYIGAL